MLVIRLQRIGKKKFPTYRLIVSEKTRDTRGAYLEALGTFNPHLKDGGFLPETERINYWMGKGAQPSPTIHNLLIKSGILKGLPKKKSVYISKKRAAKLEEKKKQAAPKEAAAQ